MGMASSSSTQERQSEPEDQEQDRQQTRYELERPPPVDQLPVVYHETPEYAYGVADASALMHTLMRSPTFRGLDSDLAQRIVRESLAA